MTRLIREGSAQCRRYISCLNPSFGKKLQQSRGNMNQRWRYWKKNREDYFCPYQGMRRHDPELGLCRFNDATLLIGKFEELVYAIDALISWNFPVESDPITGLKKRQ